MFIKCCCSEQEQCIGRSGHEIEELKEGAWLESALALLRKKTKGDWTGKHRNVARKLVLEGG